MKTTVCMAKITLIFGATAFLTLDFALPSSPIGFASQAGGTTGGKGGTTHTVSTGTALQDLLTKNASGLIIYVSGTITPANSPSEQKINVKEVSNISIIGSGANGIFNGVGIKIVKSNNIIIQNLIIHHVNVGDKDCISIEGPVDHVWVDHCELYNDLDHDKDYYDGLLDAKAESEYITVSRCYLHHSYKTSLVGSSSGDTYDRKMTYCFNYFLDCNSRTPSYRGGVGHIFNNVFICTSDTIGATAINSRVGAKLRIEGNYFQGLGSGEIDDDGDLKLPMGPIGAYYEAPGCWDVKDNIFVGCKGSQPTTSSCGYTPPYSYTAMGASDVRNNVWNDVGAQGSGIRKVEIENGRTTVESPEKKTNGPSFTVTREGLRIVTGELGSMRIKIMSIDGKTIASGVASVTCGMNLLALPRIGSNGTFNGIVVIAYYLNGIRGTRSIVSNQL